MKIAFVCAGMEINGDATETRALGGTETALIGIARALARTQGCSVDVFTATARPGTYQGVEFHPLHALAQWSTGQDVDVLVSIRKWTPFILPVRARLRVYWSPDAFTQRFVRSEFELPVTHAGGQARVPLFPPAEFMHNVDAIYCVSRWQASTFVSELGFPAAKIAVIGNGHLPGNFDPLPREERRRQLFYSTVPSRGLEHLLRYLPALREQHPGLGLEVCSGMGVYGMAPDEDRAKYGQLYQQLADLGAISHGSVVQSQLHRLMSAAYVYAYPATVPETYCISVLEAQAAGLPVVTSRLGALAERVAHGEDGFLIDGTPGDPAYDSAFVDAVSRLLRDEALWTAMSNAARAKAAPQTYDAVAAQWVRDIVQRLQGRPARGGNPQPRLPSLAGVQLTAPDGSHRLNLSAADMRGLLQSSVARYGFRSD